LIALIAFYLFATLTIASAVAVIFARNPVHSVLWLILAFFNAAGLMLIMGAEFIAMLLVIISLRSASCSTAASFCRSSLPA
jgi:NADH-quinone oxidoreductase subunit J